MGDRLVVRRGRQKGGSFPLSKTRPLTLGRSTRSDLQVLGDGVSREHCTVEWLGDRGGYEIRDLGSATGTFVGRERIGERMLRPGQRIRVGRTELELVTDRSGAEEVEPVLLFESPDDDPNDSEITRRLDDPSETTLLRRLDDVVEVREARRIKEKLEVLYRVSNMVNTEEDPATLNRLILATVAEVSQADRAFLFHYDKEARSAKAIAVWDPKARRGKRTLPVSRRILYRAFSETLSVYRPDVDGAAGRSSSKKPSERRAVVCAPVVSGEGVDGALYLDAPADQSRLDEDDMEMLTAVGRQLGTALARLRARRELQALKEFSEEVIGIMPVGIMVLDEAGRVLLTNGAMSRIVEDRLAHIRGEPVENVLKLAGEGAETFRGGLDNVRQTGVAVHLQDLQYLPAVGSERHLEVHMQAMDAAPEGRRVLMVVDDVTESRQLQLQVLQTGRMASVGALAAGVAHEFNNIMAAIHGYAELARDNKDYQERLVEVTLKQSARATSIVDGLMTFSRKKDRQRQPLDVRIVLKSVLQLVEREAGQNDIAFRRNFEAVSMVYADPAQLQQVFLNLVINAFHAIGRSGSVTLRCRDSGSGEVHVSVSDTGHGIPEETLPRVFDPFFTTKGALGRGGAVPGTGLGLSVSYNIIKDHDGWIEVTSREGEGATFTVRLPAATPEQLKAGPVREEGPRVQIAGRYRILIADDEEPMRGLLGEILSDHRVFQVESGREALDLIDREPVDFLLLDILLSGPIDGFEVLDRIRRAHAGVKIILVTGRVDDERLTDAIARADGYIKKPFGVNEVRLALAACEKAEGGSGRQTQPGRDAGA